MERGKVDKLLETIFIEEGPEGIVEAMSFLYGAFVVTRNGIILGANKGFCELVNYPLSELRGKPATDFVIDEQKAQLAEVFASNSHVPYKLCLQSKNGELKYTQVFPKVFTVRGELYRLAEFADFTDNYHAQRTLQESEEKFKTFFNYAPIAIAKASLQGDWQEFNPQFCAFLGYTEAQLRLKTVIDITHPDDLKTDITLLNELQTGKRSSYSLEKRYIKQDKTVVWGRLSVTLIRDPDDNPDFYLVFIEDIHEQKLLNEQLLTSDLIVSASSDMLAVLDADCRYIAMNNTYAHAFGKLPSDLIGKSVTQVFDKVVYESLLKANQEIVRSGNDVNFSAWFNYPITGRQYMNVSYSPIMDEDSQYQGFAVSARNLTDLKVAEIEMRELNKKLQRYSYLDGLTRITNRRMFDENIDSEWNRAMRTDSTISFIMLDIDFFKNYNDHYGHLQGDECLVKIAQTLKTVAGRSSDIVARYGGEEFAILLPSANIEQATYVAERCRKAVIDLQIPHATTQVDGIDVVSVSLGVACMVPALKSSAFTLLDIADKRLYQAKHQGRNRTIAE